MVQAEGEASPRSFSVIAQRDACPLWAEDGRASEFLMLDGKPAIRLVGDDWHVTWADEITQPVAPVDQRASSQFQEALDLLGRTMPEYRDWVVCLLREITPIRSPGEDAYSSGSSLWRFGGIDLSVPASPVQTAEMLVHECTHLYFLLASWTGPVVTPDAKPYYSPLKDCERPLEKILTGYHALGNQFIALDKFRTQGFEKEVSDRLGTISSQLEQMRPPMENEVGLSELGLAFSRPLRARLAQERRAA
jgi:HEXXH motif-containing protein